MFRFTVRALRAQCLGLTAALALSGSLARAGQFRVLHTFDTPGQRALGGLTAVGDKLFGTAAAIWTNSTPPPFGYIFSLDRDGSNYQVLHEFAGPEGANPEDSLTPVGDQLIGTTGGRRSGQPETGNRGTLFSINPDGTNYQVLREFQGTGGTPNHVRAPVLSSGAKFYTTASGPAARGYVLSTDPDGANLQVLHAFTGGDGANPWGGLTQVGSTFYGTTHVGGAHDAGVVYSLGIDGSGFQVLHEFAGGTSDGARPRGELTLVGETLFGTTVNGGDSDEGTVWSINLDGSDYEVVHFFENRFLGGRPQAGLTLLEETLYGTGQVSLFSIDVDGSGFEIVHEFDQNVGFSSQSELVLIEETLYGTTVFGGSAANSGTVFAYTIPEPNSIALAAFGLLAVGAVGLRRKRW